MMCVYMIHTHTYIYIYYAEHIDGDGYKLDFAGCQKGEVYHQIPNVSKTPNPTIFSVETNVFDIDFG